MAGQKKVGVYWGKSGISLVEVAKDAPSTHAFISFSALSEATTESVTEDARLLDLIQRTLRNQGFSSIDAFLSLPSSDIILRWFSIPWMRPHEIQGVVAFEARKYSPFPLEELVYTYYPSTYVKEGVKQIGIVFVGIRKDVLNRYVTVLSQSGLNVVFSEPSCMSVLRALVARKAVDVSKVMGVLKIDNNDAEIDVCSGGFVKFVRDFSLTGAAPTPVGGAEDYLHAKIYNEARLSLDFFTRQHTEDIQSMVLVTVPLNKELSLGLGDDLGVPVFPVDPATIMGIHEPVEIGALEAYGCALSGLFPTVIDFNLSEGNAEAGVQVVKQESARPTVHPVIFPIISGIVSLLLVTGTWFLTSRPVVEKQRSIEQVRQTLGLFGDMDQGTIEEKKNNEKKHLDAIKPLTFRSDLTPFSIRVVKFLPEGMWLESISFKVQEAKKSKSVTVSTLSLNIRGLIFLGDRNAEFDKVNEFLAELKNDPEIAKLAPGLKLTALGQDERNNHKLTKFELTSQ